MVVDTNVLMSNMASMERVFADLAAAAALDSLASGTGVGEGGGEGGAGAAGAAGAVGRSSPSQPLVEVLMVVPWVVLNELDRLKHR